MVNRRSVGAVYLAAFIALSYQPYSLAQNAAPVPASTPETSAPQTGNAANAPAVDFQNADSILRAAVPRTLQNRRAAMSYTTTGKPIADYSARFDVIFLEGLPYRRQIEENQKPLSRSQAADEQRRYDQAFAERSRMTIDQKRDYLRRPWNVDVPLPQLATLFTNSIVGEEAVEGRPAIIIQSVPRSDVLPPDEEDRRAMHKLVKLWIDREDLIVSRIEATLIADDAAMLKGTVAQIDFERKDAVWVPSQSDVQFRAMSDSKIVVGETSEVNDDFHRFHVDVRLLDPTQAATPSQAQ
jgi:hypothetical protein